MHGSTAGMPAAQRLLNAIDGNNKESWAYRPSKPATVLVRTPIAAEAK